MTQVHPFQVVVRTNDSFHLRAEGRMDEVRLTSKVKKAG